MTDAPATTPEPAAEQPYESVSMVYIGERTGDRKLSHVYQEVEKYGALLDAVQWFDKALVPGGCYIGAVYMYQRRGSKYGMAGKLAPVYERAWPDREQVLAWQVAERAAILRQDESRRATRDGAEMDVLRQALRPLRMYMGGVKRATDYTAMLAIVMAELARPLTKAEREELQEGNVRARATRKS